MSWASFLLAFFLTLLSRFATVGMLALAHEPFSRARAWTDVLAEVFARRPPAVVLVPAPGAGEREGEVWQPPFPSGPLRVLQDALRARYVLERSFGPMDLYRLRTGGGS